ncbi:hypothetical protein V1523DRAFT_87297 [Lipomyces doorenjongii]
MSFSRLVRFISTDGKTYVGDAILPAFTYDARKATHAKVITGDVFGEYKVTNEKKVGEHLWFADNGINGW